jgi:hypothetical protein
MLYTNMVVGSGFFKTKLHIALFLKKIKEAFKVLRKSKNKDIKNYVFYQCVKFELKIPYIQGCTK